MESTPTKNPMGISGMVQWIIIDSCGCYPRTSRSGSFLSIYRGTQKWSKRLRSENVGRGAFEQLEQLDGMIFPTKPWEDLDHFRSHTSSFEWLESGWKRRSSWGNGSWNPIFYSGFCTSTEYFMGSRPPKMNENKWYSLSKLEVGKVFEFT